MNTNANRFNYWLTVSSSASSLSFGPKLLRYSSIPSSSLAPSSTAVAPYRIYHNSIRIWKNTFFEKCRFYIMRAKEIIEIVVHFTVTAIAIILRLVSKLDREYHSSIAQWEEKHLLCYTSYGIVVLILKKGSHKILFLYVARGSIAHVFIVEIRLSKILK